MRRIISALLVLVGLTAVAPSAAAGQFKKPVYYKLNGGPYQIISADFNHDGNLDLAVAQLADSSVGILLGKGNGTFHSAQYFTAPNAVALAAGDFNGDGKLDLAVVESGGTGNGALGIFLGDGKGNFHHSVSYKLGLASGSVAAADFDGDGHLDIAVTNAGANGNGSVMVFFGRGDGTFKAPTTYRLSQYPNVVATADLNGDHYPDLVVAQNIGSVTVLTNDGRGGFKKQRTYGATSGADGIAIADFRNTGILDLAVTGTPNTVAVLLGNGDGTFGTATGYSTQVGNGYAQAVVAAHFGGGGKIDLAVECTGNASALLYGNGDGTFQSPVPIKTRENGGYSLTVGDFNKDGFQDLAMDALGSGDRVSSIAVLINTQ